MELSCRNQRKTRRAMMLPKVADLVVAWGSLHEAVAHLHDADTESAEESMLAVAAVALHAAARIPDRCRCTVLIDGPDAESGAQRPG